MSENLMARLSRERARRLQELAENGQDALESDPLARLRIIWPGYFADRAAAPRMPSTGKPNFPKIKT